MRPKRPRFCIVVVVIGVAVGTAVTATDGVVADGVVSGVLEGSGAVSWADGSGASWAGRPTLAASSIEKIMARRIIDGLETKR